MTAKKQNFKIKKRKRGRPSSLNDNLISELEVAFMVGATIRIACASVGLSEDTFYFWQREANAVRDRLDQERIKEDQRDHEITLAAEVGDPLPEPYIPDLNITPQEAKLLKFLKTIEEAEALGAIGHLNNIQQNSVADPSLSQWILQNRYGYGKTSTQEVIHKGDPDHPLEIKTDDIPIEERAARLALIFQAAEKRMNDQQAQDDGSV